MKYLVVYMNEAGIFEPYIGHKIVVADCKDNAINMAYDFLSEIFPRRPKSAWRFKAALIIQKDGKIRIWR